MSRFGLAMTLQDSAALAESWGMGTRIALGTGAEDADIYGPAGLTLSEHEAAAALKSGAGACFVSFGNQASPPDLAALAQLLELATGRTGPGFMAACFANPEFGRTVYQGHLFQDGRLVTHLRNVLSEQVSGRVAVIAHEVIAAGPKAILRRISAAREQGVALALLDAVDAAQCAAITQALAGQICTGGPAWLSPHPLAPKSAPALPTGRTAILSGALDRQTLYQLGAARLSMPFLQLDAFTPAEAVRVLAWAAAQTAEKIIISASAPPDRLQNSAPVAEFIAGLAAGLAAQNFVRFIVTGNDTAAAVLRRLGIKSVAAQGQTAGLCWLGDENYSLLLKPGGFGPQKLFMGEFEPQLRLNAAAE